jgi:hypothetical protein
MLYYRGKWMHPHLCSTVVPSYSDFLVSTNGPRQLLPIGPEGPRQNCCIKRQKARSDGFLASFPYSRLRRLDALEDHRQ